MGRPKRVRGPLLPLEVELHNSLDLSERTRAAYAESFHRFTQFAGTDPSNWTRQSVDAWLRRLLREEGLLPQTVRVHRKALRQISALWARKFNGEDFAANADKVKVSDPVRKEILTNDEIEKLLATCDSSIEGVRDYALLVTVWRTAMRSGGLQTLTFERLKPPSITILLKGGNAHTFTADEDTWRGLNPWLKILRANGITRGFVFRRIGPQAAIGEAALTGYQIWGVIKARAAAAGVRDIHPHLFRHTTITRLREAGVATSDISALTGQKERTIEDIYSHMRTTKPVSAAMPSLGRRR